MVEEFYTLEEYAKCVKESLENILHDWQMAEDSRPLVVYATAPIAYAKAQERFANGSNVGPLIAFYQSGIEVDHNVQMGAWKVMPVIRKEGNYLYRAPVICKINYTVTIHALTEIQADNLQAQIMLATPFHRPYYTKFNGEFVLIESTEYSNLSSVDVGENKDKFSSRQITLTIDRAYLNYDIKELNAGVIKPKPKNVNTNKVFEERTNENGKIEFVDKDGNISAFKEVEDGVYINEETKNKYALEKNENGNNVLVEIEPPLKVFTEAATHTDQKKYIDENGDTYYGDLFIHMDNGNYVNIKTKEEFHLEKDENGNNVYVEVPVSYNKQEMEIVNRLKNGAVVYKNGSIGDGIEVKNTSDNGYAPFNYNVLDENGNVVQVTQKGKVKIKMYSLEGVR